MQHPSDAPFPVTRWSLVSGARRDADPARREAALQELCTHYWGPIYGFLRRRGLPPPDAEDAAQGFMLSLLEDDLFAKADASSGRLRSFLLGALQRWQRGEWRRASAEKRGSGRLTLSLEALRAESGLEPEGTDEASPERWFEKRCALVLLESALQRLAEEQAAAGKAETFAALRPLLAPSADAPAVSHESVAAALGISHEAVRVALHRLRRRFATVLRDTIADTLTHPTEEAIAEELAALRAAWAE